MDEKVSIIVPVYNVEKYLDKCIESIVNQTYRNIEIILVDDGSPDKCPEVCNEWAKKDDRIKVIHKENGGLSSARNAALEIAQGDYITFVDSDDWIENDMIQSMLTCAAKNDADIVCCGFYFDNVDTTGHLQKFEKAEYENEEIVLNLLLDNIRPEVCSKLYSAELINQFRFDESIKYAEDLPFNFYLMLKAKKLCCTGMLFYHYLLNSGNSITTAYITDARANSWKMFNGFLKTCKGNKELETAVIYRFTVYTFAILSRVMNVEEFSEKYFNEIVEALLEHKSEILNNSLISNKHKKAIYLLSFNKIAFKTSYKFTEFVSRVVNWLKA